MDDRLLQPFLDECVLVVDRLRDEVAEIDGGTASDAVLAKIAADLGDLKVGCGFLGLAELGSAVVDAERAVESSRAAGRAGGDVDASLVVEQIAAIAACLSELRPDVPLCAPPEPEPSPERDETEAYALALYVAPPEPVEEVADEFPAEPGSVDNSTDPDEWRPSVLVVDDSLFYRELLRASLADAGHHVTTADSAAAAIELLTEDDAFDVVVSELALPDADGCTLAETLCQDSEAPPLIALVAGSREAERDRALEAGFRQLLVKYRTRELVTAIGDACAGRVAA